MMGERLHICVDSNEASIRRDIVNYFRLSGFDVEVKRLDVCDYVVSDRCGVERKNASDFLSSLKDGRLFNQAGIMDDTYEKPILILEGSLSRALRHSRIRESSVCGALSSLALDYSVSVLPSESSETTSVLLHRLAYREQVKEERSVQLRSVNKSMPLHQQQIFLLSGLPQIGATLAEELLQQFDSPFRVIEEISSAEIRVSKTGKTKRLTGPLMKVKGVGPIIVEGAKRLLLESFSELCKV
jgi:Fanconi anemia group M protein